MYSVSICSQVISDIPLAPDPRRGARRKGPTAAATEGKLGLGAVGNLKDGDATSPPVLDRRRPAGPVAGLRSASPARRVAAAAALVLACLALSPQAQAQNNAPTASNNAVTTDEDTAYAFDAGEFGFSDMDSGAALAKVKIVTLPAAGTLANDGTAVTENQEISRADIDADRLVFTPAADANGDAHASFTFKVNDGTAESVATYTMTIDVTPVNDPPRGSGGRITTDEDVPYVFKLGDFSFSDVESGSELVNVRILGTPGNGSLTVGGTAVARNQLISRADIVAGRMVFASWPNQSGRPGSSYTSFTFRVNDGTDDSRSFYTMAVFVNAVNDPPTASNKTVTTREDTGYAFDVRDFNFSDVESGTALSKVKIVTLPGAGTLANDGTAVTANQEISRADIVADRLVFTPAADASGDAYASFDFRVSDGTDESVSSYTMTVDVTAVNDRPTASNYTVTTDEDSAYAFNAGDFRFSDVESGAALAKVKIVSLPAAGTLANDGTAVTANQEISRADIDADRLVFTPAADANGDGYASFDFRVNDGTADSASSYTMTINVTPVNDPPTASNKTVTAREDTPYAFDAGAFNFSDIDTGAALAKVTIVTLPGAGALANDGTAVTAGQEVSRADIDADRLVFTPAADASGDAYASFTFRVSDGTAESASSYTMTINVTAVNDPPTASNKTVTAREDTAYAFNAGDFRFSDVESGAALAKVKIVTLPAAGTLANDGTAVTAGQEVSRADIDADRLVFTPAADANGNAYASFDFRVSDGTDESASSYTMTINVTAVNDPPTASNNTVNAREDTPYAFDAGAFNFSDIDTGAALAKVKIVTLPDGRHARQ